MINKDDNDMHHHDDGEEWINDHRQKNPFLRLLVSFSTTTKQRYQLMLLYLMLLFLLLGILQWQIICTTASQTKAHSYTIMGTMCLHTIYIVLVNVVMNSCMFILLCFVILIHAFIVWKGFTDYQWVTEQLPILNEVPLP